MCNVYSIVNQKGGVGKSVTAANLGIGIALQGKRVPNTPNFGHVGIFRESGYEYAKDETPCFLAKAGSLRIKGRGIS